MKSAGPCRRWHLGYQEWKLLPVLWSSPFASDSHDAHACQACATPDQTPTDCLYVEHYNYKGQMQSFIPINGVSIPMAELIRRYSQHQILRAKGAVANPNPRKHRYSLVPRNAKSLP